MEILPSIQSKQFRRPAFLPQSAMTSPFDAIEERMNNLWNNFMITPAVMPTHGLSASYYPNVDLEEKEDSYFLEAEVPGMAREDIHLDLHNNVLTIKGEKEIRETKKDADMVRTERCYGTFAREIAFDEEISPDKVAAELKDGVLKIELKKTNGKIKKHKKIDIKG